MASDAPQVTILSRKECGPCKTVLHLARRLQPELRVSLTEIDIDANSEFSARYGERIPVILIDGVEACSGIVTEDMLRRAIKGARWRKPISRILSRLGLRPKR